MTEPRLDQDRIPTHVGLILDGNGRWAEQRDLPRTAGHAAGEAALFATIESARELGVSWLSAYTFSTENWSRSDDEVEFLMLFNEDLLLRRRGELHAKGTRIYFAGDMDDTRIPERNRARMVETEAMTAANQGMRLVFAFNYGGRVEITEAARRLGRLIRNGELDPEQIDAKAVAGQLYVPDMPDVDLVIRTSGEMRLSNFLLWQAAYAEFVFPEVLWPDFDREHLVRALAEYQRRKRRFGTA
ncbi:MAG TPA: polyprenyl diphosphate synthase [Acidimicrobiia bacterium]|nr:polyprenyl diphosphate synthase [Acidimicrobiia bacterium]